jgi:hypothetical protein
VAIFALPPNATPIGNLHQREGQTAKTQPFAVHKKMRSKKKQALT